MSIILNLKTKNVTYAIIEVFCEGILFFSAPFLSEMKSNEEFEIYVKLPLTTFCDNYSLKITSNETAIIYEPYKIFTIDENGNLIKEKIYKEPSNGKGKRKWGEKENSNQKKNYTRLFQEIPRKSLLLQRSNSW